MHLESAPMREPRRWRLDLFAGALLLSGVFTAVAVFSHDPADSVALSLQPAQPVPANLLGPLGAWLSAELYGLIGEGVYPFFAAWFVLVILFFLRRDVGQWLIRLAGWALLVPAVAVTADALGPAVSVGPVSNGGALGAWLGNELAQATSPLGHLLVTSGAILLGILLILSSFLGRAIQLVWGFAKASLHALRRLVPRLPRVRPKIKRPTPPTVSAKPPVNAPVKAQASVDIPIHHAVGPVVTPSAPAPVSPDQYADYELPPLSLLEDAEAVDHQGQDQVLRDRAVLLEKTFHDFGLKVRVVGIHTGPVVTQYEVALETGLRVNKVTALADDLALNLKVPSVRIVAPIPGKNTVGIEVPNEKRAKVRLKEVMLGASPRVASRGLKLPLFIGKDTEGKPLIGDMAEMPHLLIAGRTGTGKSVCMNALILSLLMTRRPDEVKMIMIDPKMLELIEYSKIPHLMHPVVKDMKKAEAILAWAVDKMEERYDILSRARVRGIAAYNELSYDEILRRVQPADEEEKKHIPQKMPYIVIFIDEMADLIMQMKKEVEGHIIRLAQKSRAAGIHLVLATQKPIVDVVTSLIKSNLPARICFQVSSRTDSAVVLDEKGGEKLLGKGDMLFLVPNTSTLVRAQGTYASDEEIHGVVKCLECDNPNYEAELVRLNTAGKDGGSFIDSIRARDPLYEQAIEIVVRESRGSTSLLQRAMGIGYGRAARLIDYMAEDGIVGAYNGSQAREVLYKPEEWEQLKQPSTSPA
jgi:DNA segregation ATPase FtsK/SpoIIIE, S-DNA-T family